MAEPIGSGPPAPGGLRGIWRSIRRLFGDPITRERISAVGPTVQQLVRTELEAANTQTTAQGESTRVVIRDALAVLRSDVAEFRADRAQEEASTRQLYDDRTATLRIVIEHQSEATRQSLDQRMQVLRHVVEFQSEVTRNVMADHARRSAGFEDLIRLYQMVGAWRRTTNGADNVRLTITTTKPVAYSSPDHQHPWGTKQDNHTNLRFTFKLCNWLGLDGMSLLDIGCSGGGFVKTLHDLGCLAAGVEGSDYSKIRGRAEWGTIPHRLFTADATVPFAITPEGSNAPVRFRVVTTWEFLEHIRTNDLPAVFANFERHLATGGVIVCSVNSNDDIIDGVNLHQTVQPPEWWFAEVERLGFRHHPEAVAYFGDDWVRDQQNATGSFYLVLTRSGEPLPNRNSLHPDLRPGA